ncbi:hypothetical protein I4Q36_04330 [Tuanshanicoccus lijuaniae]|uniref:hypothetical protein n=1 Tax=Aerococcaceae bacterium zg-1292 TaxID=2774330 RepID=UPI0019350105|nr:hypothetical protein I4Q36_04330 [Aerococcaceae bacterium zg-1292]
MLHYVSLDGEEIQPPHHNSDDKPVGEGYTVLDKETGVVVKGKTDVTYIYKLKETPEPGKPEEPGTPPVTPEKPENLEVPENPEDPSMPEAPKEKPAPEKQLNQDNQLLNSQVKIKEKLKNLQYFQILVKLAHYLV